jgi:hypothetical protein
MGPSHPHIPALVKREIKDKEKEKKKQTNKGPGSGFRYRSCTSSVISRQAIMSPQFEIVEHIS